MFCQSFIAVDETNKGDMKKYFLLIWLFVMHRNRQRRGKIKFQREQNKVAFSIYRPNGFTAISDTEVVVESQIHTWFGFKSKKHYVQQLFIETCC
jgi:hypothetical protein